MAQEEDPQAEEQAEIEEDPRETERKEEYRSFRQNLDRFKGEQEGMTSEAEQMKQHGNAYFTFGCYSQASLMYTEAIELNPHSEVLYCNRAMSYLKQDMADLALADAQRSLDINSDVGNIKAYWRKAQALLLMDRFQDSEAAAGEGLELQPRNPHLNKARRKAREAVVTKTLGAGDWAGKMNGFEQRYTFGKDGEMSMSIMGHRVPSTYELSVEGNPRSMVVKMKEQIGPGSGPPTPPMVYIFEFHDDDKELWLCHPVDGSRDLPTKFEGPGFLKYRRVEAKAPDAGVASTDPLEKRCKDYMIAMSKVIPQMARQLPEKPSEQQIAEEVEVCGRVSELKTKYGLEVHRLAVELAKNPSSADGEEMQELAQQLRRRFIARGLLPTDPKAKAPQKAAADVAAPEKSSAAPEAAAAKPVAQELAAPQPSHSRSPDLLSRLATCICCKSN